MVQHRPWHTWNARRRCSFGFQAALCVGRQEPRDRGAAAAPGRRQAGDCRCLLACTCIRLLRFGALGRYSAWPPWAADEGFYCLVKSERGGGPPAASPVCNACCITCAHAPWRSSLPAGGPGACRGSQLCAPPPLACAMITTTKPGALLRATAVTLPYARAHACMALQLHLQLATCSAALPCSAAHQPSRRHSVKTPHVAAAGQGDAAL